VTEDTSANSKQRRFSTGQRVLVWLIAVAGIAVSLPGPFFGIPLLAALLLGFVLFGSNQKAREIVEEGGQLYAGLLAIIWWGGVLVFFVWLLVRYWGR
jgi:hypothetical protein